MKTIVIIAIVITIFILSIVWNIKSNPWNLCVNKEKGMGSTTSQAYKVCAEAGY